MRCLRAITRTMEQATNLTNLPAELIELIGESVERERDLNSLVLVNQMFNRQLTPQLYHRGTLGRGRVPGRSALRWAATHGQVDTLRRAMAVGVDIGEDPELLAWAASHGDEATIALIVEAGGFDVNARGKHRRRALFWAVQRMDFRLAELLLNTLGADIVKCSRPGSILILFLIINGHPSRADMARLLIENGAPIDLSSGGPTPLQLAVHHKDYDMTKVLLEYGANLTETVSNHDTVVHWAIISGCIGVVRLLLRAWVERRERISTMSTPLLQLAAYEHRNHEMADLILESGDPGNGVYWDHEAYDVMCECAARGDLECVKVFVRHGVTRPESLSEDLWPADMNPLTMALASSSSNKAEVVRLLVHAGYDLPDIVTPGGTRLHTAVLHENAETVALLLEAGADPMAVDMAGATPAHQAARMGRAEVVRLLRDAPGVDITASDRVGRSPLFYAAMRGRCSVITVLVGDLSAGTARILPGNKRDVYGTSPIIAAARNGCRSTVSKLLELDPDSADDVDREGRSIAWWLEKSGCEPLSELTTDWAPKAGAGKGEWLDGMLGQDQLDVEKECWCYVCTRYTVHPSAALAKTCLDCYDGGGFLICCECEGREAPFCDPSHEKATHMCT